MYLASSPKIQDTTHLLHHISSQFLERELFLCGKAYQLRLTVFCLRDFMTDLLLQDFAHLTKEARVGMLSKERREMLGEKEVVSKKRTVSILRFGFLALSFRKLGRASRRI
jgi:hypothetical protein